MKCSEQSMKSNEKQWKVLKTLSKSSENIWEAMKSIEKSNEEAIRTSEKIGKVLKQQWKPIGSNK